MLGKFTIAAFIVIFINSIIITLVEKKAISFNNDIRTLYIVGYIIPLLAVYGEYTYYKTDTTLEFIIVVALFYIAILSVFGYMYKFKSSKYSDFIFIGIFIYVTIMVKIVSPLMLNRIKMEYCTVFIVGIIVSSIIAKQDKWKIVVTLLLFMMIISNRTDFFNHQSKVEIFFSEYIESTSIDVDSIQYVEKIKDKEAIRNNEIPIEITYKEESTDIVKKLYFIYENESVHQDNK